MRDAVVVEAVRTPIGKGKPNGALAHVHPVELLAHTLRTLVERSGVDPALIETSSAARWTRSANRR